LTGRVGGIQSLLGSTLERQGSPAQASSGLSSANVDAAMASVLPGLQLQLGNDLEQTLTSEKGDNASTRDTVLGGF
jgi:hypothetical protein